MSQFLARDSCFVAENFCWLSQSSFLLFQLLDTFSFLWYWIISEFIEKRKTWEKLFKNKPQCIELWWKVFHHRNSCFRRHKLLKIHRLSFFLLPYRALNNVVDFGRKPQKKDQMEFDVGTMLEKPIMRRIFELNFTINRMMPIKLLFFSLWCFSCVWFSFVAIRS